MPGIYNMPGPQDAQGLASMQALQQLGRLPMDQKVKDEFMAIFYKELLKQAFKAPQIGITDGEENNQSFASLFTSDLLVEKLALELARNKSFSIDGLFPGVIEEKEKK